jgi:hypothetical protein
MIAFVVSVMVSVVIAVVMSVVMVVIIEICQHIEPRVPEAPTPEGIRHP